MHESIKVINQAGSNWHKYDWPFRAPNGCTQFVTGTGGNIQSYNFQGGNQLAEQDWSTCLRQEEGYFFRIFTWRSFSLFMTGFCSFQVQEAVGVTTPDPFNLLNLNPTAGMPPLIGVMVNYLSSKTLRTKITCVADGLHDEKQQFHHGAQCNDQQWRKVSKSNRQDSIRLPLPGKSFRNRQFLQPRGRKSVSCKSLELHRAQRRTFRGQLWPVFCNVAQLTNHLQLAIFSRCS